MLGGCGHGGARPVRVSAGADAVTVENDAGAWTIAWRARPGLSAGAVVRLVPAGTDVALVDESRRRGPLNLPRTGGLGGFGWHEAHRRGCCDRRFVGRTRDAEIEPDHAWDVDARHRGAFGVAFVHHTRPHFRDGRAVVRVTAGYRDLWHDPVLVARYRWSFGRRDATLRLRVTEHGDAQTYVKEPKIALSLRDTYPHVTVIREGRAVGQCNVGHLRPANELRSSCQLRAAVATVRFDDGLDGCRGRPCLLARIDARGLRRWARRSDRRACFAALGHARADRARGCRARSAGGCLRRGKLPQQWELHRLGGYEQLLVAAWTGGSGAYDCPVASRRFGPDGESFVVRVRLTLTATS